MRLVLTRLARSDLRRIFEYIAADSPSRAQVFIERVWDRLELLAAHPHMGRPRPEFGPDVRSFPVRPIVVFYRAREDRGQTQILRIIDGRRDLGTVFAEDP